jgi:hypothetical protein
VGFPRDSYDNIMAVRQSGFLLKFNGFAAHHAVENRTKRPTRIDLSFGTPFKPVPPSTPGRAARSSALSPHPPDTASQTLAFFALVIAWLSTVNSMSSQTQPQKVQVAFSTIFNSGMPDPLSFLGRHRDVQVSANLSDQHGFNLGVPGNCRLEPRGKVDVDRVACPFPVEGAVMVRHVSDKLAPFHWTTGVWNLDFNGIVST